MLGFQPVSASPLSASGATLGVIQEVGVASDAPAATAAFLRPMAEAGAASEAMTAAAVFPVARVEAGAAAETVTGPVAFQGLGTDTLAPSEAVNASVVFSGVIAEAGAAAGNPSATTLVVAAQTETGAAADFPNAGAVHPTAIAETGASTDVIDGPAGHPGDLPEAINSTNVQTATMTGPGLLVEVGVATSIEAGTQIDPVTIANPLAATDIINALIGQLLESALLTFDNPDASSVVIGAVSQSMPATDTMTTVMSTVQDLVNSVAMTDTLAVIIIARGRLDETLTPIEGVRGEWSASTNISSGLVPVDVVQILATFFLGQLEQTSPPADSLSAQGSFAAQLTNSLTANDAVIGITVASLLETRALIDSVSPGVAFFSALFEQGAPEVVLIARVDFAPQISETLAAVDTMNSYITLTGLGTVVVMSRARYSAAVSTFPPRDEE